MNTPETSTDLTTSLLVDLLKPVIADAIADAMVELTERVQPRPPKPFTIEEAADYLSFPKSSLYQLTCKRQIPFYKNGRKLHFYQDELDQWIKKGRV